MKVAVDEDTIRQAIENGPCDRAREVLHGESSIQGLPDPGICAHCDLMMELLVDDDVLSDLVKVTMAIFQWVPTNHSDPEHDEVLRRAMLVVGEDPTEFFS